MSNEYDVVLEAIFEQVSEINDNLRILLNRTLSGKSRSSWNDDDVTESGIDKGKIRALRKAGWSFQKIAEEVGCSKSAVLEIVKKEATKNNE
jgi:ribosome-binding protein aMBF1 (putative translation factor)